PLLEFALCPDTTVFRFQPGEGSSDGHRWQQFAILPDRWKNVAFGGTGAACMLYVDVADRRGDESVWSTVMDDIGGTAASKWGPSSGVPPGTSRVSSGSVTIDGAVFTHQTTQAGPLWDLSGVKAGESLDPPAGNLGSRLANTAGLGFAAGRQSRQGPTAEML